jgi:hypothetical protein
VAELKSEWPRLNRNRWPTSFRNQWPTSPGISRLFGVPVHGAAGVKGAVVQQVEE